SYFFPCFGYHLVLHSFPTRRSSDLFDGMTFGSLIDPDSRQKATLHQGQIFALYNHPSGFSGSIEGYWARQSNVGYFPDEPGDNRSEEHTSELQSRSDLVCRLLLEKK